MENTRWVKIDASKSKEKVCESAIKELENLDILPRRADDNTYIC